MIQGDCRLGGRHRSGFGASENFGRAPNDRIGPLLRIGDREGRSRYRGSCGYAAQVPQGTGGPASEEGRGKRRVRPSAGCQRRARSSGSRRGRRAARPAARFDRASPSRLVPSRGGRRLDRADRRPRHGRPPGQRRRVVRGHGRDSRREAPPARRRAARPHGFETFGRVAPASQSCRSCAPLSCASRSRSRSSFQRSARSRSDPRARPNGRPGGSTAQQLTSRRSCPGRNPPPRPGPLCPRGSLLGGRGGLVARSFAGHSGAAPRPVTLRDDEQPDHTAPHRC